MELIIIKNVSKKNNKPYVVLAVDIGYKTIPLTYDMLTICEVANITPYTLGSMNIGDIIKI